MDAVRCEQCGDVRWSFSGFGPSVARSCEACGTAMVPERRVPLHVVASATTPGPAGPGRSDRPPLPPAA